MGQAEAYLFTLNSLILIQHPLDHHFRVLEADMSPSFRQLFESRRGRSVRHQARSLYSMDQRVRLMLQALELRDVPSAPAPPPGFLSTTDTFTNTNPVTIPSTGTPTVSSTITVSGIGTYIHDVDLKTFIRHTWNSDLHVTLQSPSGTVVTITTANGGSNVDVFNGTLWDDSADPGNQVPYTAPSATSNMVTDTKYTSGVAKPTLTPEEPLAAFIGEDPNGVWTLTIYDAFDLDGGTLDQWSLIITTLDGTASLLPQVSFTNNTPVTIPASGTPTVSSTMTVSDAPTYLKKLTLQTFITHTWNSDLHVTLQSPSGTVVTITTANGGSNDDVFNGTLWDDSADPGNQVPYTAPSATSNMVTDTKYTSGVAKPTLTPEEPLAAFIGEDPNGVWTLTIYDAFNFDGGQLSSWTLNVFGVAPFGVPTAKVSSAPPVTTPGGTGYTFAITYSDNTAIDVSTLGNDDIRITGPSGFSQLATLVSVDVPGNGTPRTATYTITAPGGNWGNEDNGSYSIIVEPNSVFDEVGLSVPDGTIGTFTVTVPFVAVVTNLNDSGPGSLRDAIAVVNGIPGADVVTFQEGLTGTISVSNGELLITDPVSIIGPGAGLITISRASNAPNFRIFHSKASDLTMSGLTVSGGKAAGGGGLLAGGNVVLDSMVFTGNTATGTAFTTGGGGIHIQAFGKLELINSTVSGNVAEGSGGGIYFYFGGSLLVRNSTISGNATTSTTNGKGGAGIYLYYATATLQNTTISGNSSSSSGGGILSRYNYGLLNIQNSTIVGNSAANSNSGQGGGGVAQIGGPGQINVVSSVVSGNVNANALDILSKGTVNVNFSAIGNGAGFTPSGSSGNNLPFGTDLKLGPLANNGGPTLTHAPLDGSPLINAGSNPVGLATDQRGPSFVRVYDGQADIGAVEVQPPSVTGITTASPSPTNATTLIFTVTFNQPVSGLSAANFDLTTTGGVTGTIGSVTGSETTWTVQVSGVSGDGTIRLDLTNAIGVTPGIAFVPYNQGQVVVIDQTAPTVLSFTRLDPDPAAGSTGRFEVVFSEPVSGLTVDNFALYTAGSVTGASIVSVTGSGATYTVTIAFGTGNGVVGLRLENSTGVADPAGNPVAGVPVVGPRYAVGEPVVFTITAPPATNAASVDFIVTLSQPVAGLSAANFELVTTGVGGASITGVSGSGDTWTVTVSTGTGDGTIRLDLVNSGGVTPAIVELPFTTGTTVVIDRTPPAVDSITPDSPALTNATTIQFTVSFSEAVVGLTASNFNLVTSGVTGATITGVSGGGDTWVVTVDTGSGDGTLRLDLVNTTGLADPAGNPVTGLPVTGPEVTIDKTPPTTESVTLVGPALTNAGTVLYTVTFSEAVVGLSASNFSLATTGTITGAGVVEVSGSGTTWTVTVNTGTGDGTIRLDLTNTTGLSDPAGNTVPGLPFDGDTVTIDKTLPAVLSIDLVGATPTNAGTVQYTLTFSEAVTGLTAANLTLVTTGTISGAAITGLTGSGTTYTVTVSTGTGDGTLRLDLANTSGISDSATNPLAGPFDGQVVTIDKTPPVGLTTGPVGANPTNAIDVAFTVTFSEPVFGLSASNFSLVTTGAVNGASIIGLSGTGAAYTITVRNGFGDGTIRLVLGSPSGVVDAAGNPLSGQPFNAIPLEIDKTFPVVEAINRLGPAQTNSATVAYTVIFSEVVVGVAPSNFSVVTSGTISGAAITSITSTDGRAYTVVINTGTGDGTVRLDLLSPLGITDRVGQPLTNGLTGSPYTIDKTPPQVTVGRAVGQAEVAGVLPVRFTVTFSEAVTGFGVDDVILGGTAGPGTVTVTGSGTTYTVTVGGLANSGTVTIAVRGGAAVDPSGNLSLPSSPSEAVTYVRNAGAVPDFYSTSALVPLTVTAPGVLANDTDPDGRPLTAVLVAGPPASAGTLVLNADGSFTFRPALGFTGTATFSYATFNGFVFGDAATVSILVTPRVTLSAVAAGAGGGPQLTVYNQDGSIRFNFFVYTPDFTGGVYVATGDVTGDGVDDIVTGAGFGGGPHIRVFDGVTGSEVSSFFAFDPSVRGGVTVAIGDVDGDGRADIIVGAGPGAGPHVKVFSADGVEKYGFFAYAPMFTGGVAVAAGDINGDGFADIVTGPGVGGGPHVQVFDGRTLQVLLNFFAFDAKSRAGVSVAIGDAYTDGTGDVFAGSGDGSVVRVFRTDRNGVRLTAFDLIDPVPAKSLRVAAADSTGDGVRDRLLVATGPGTPPLVRRFDLSTFARIDDLTNFPEDFLGGLYVG
jgi:subtilisin-like proprotein convertase family protein